MAREPLPCAGARRGEGACKGEAWERYSLGIYAGRWCEHHWAGSGYRKEGREGFDPADAGESWEGDDWGDGSW